MRRYLVPGAVIAAVIVALVVAGRLRTMHTTNTVEKAAVATNTKPTPTLYCEFYNFMRNATVVSFLFAVEQASSDLHFLEMEDVQPDGIRTAFEPDERPQWTRSIDDGTPTIASPDGATRIVLYGFKPNQPGTLWTEAGVRSDTYKNLEGKCRQAYFGTNQK